MTEMTGFPPYEPEPELRQPPPDPSARAAELHAELEAIRAAAAGGEKAMLRVTGPHDSFTHGGITVRTEAGPVPARAVAALMTAAAAAGVTIEEA